MVQVKRSFSIKQFGNRGGRDEALAFAWSEPPHYRTSRQLVEILVYGNAG